MLKTDVILYLFYSSILFKKLRDRYPEFIKACLYKGFSFLKQKCFIFPELIFSEKQPDIFLKF